jgi:hypothetical protein
MAGSVVDADRLSELNASGRASARTLIASASSLRARLSQFQARSGASGSLAPLPRRQWIDRGPKANVAITGTGFHRF